MVYECFQPLMVSFSLPGTVKLIDRLSEDYDVDALFWSDNFKEAVEVYIKFINALFMLSCYAYM